MRMNQYLLVDRKNAVYYWMHRFRFLVEHREMHRFSR